jgi:predicted phosphate transport protein (TIGR00153 family)
MRVVSECVAEVTPLFEALVKGDSEALVRIKERIFDLEQQADDVKNGLRSSLPRSLFMPVDRRDLLDVLNAQDNIADIAQDVAGLLVLRAMEVPPFMQDRLLPYVERNRDAVEKCVEVISELDELLEIGFRGKEVERVEGLIDELNRIEDDTDDMGMELVGELFAREDELKPLAVVYWVKLIDMIGDIADFAEDVGDRLRLLIAR